MKGNFGMFIFLCFDATWYALFASTLAFMLSGQRFDVCTTRKINKINKILLPLVHVP